MTDLLGVFIAGFVGVFAMGFNSRNVNNGDYAYAAMTSLFIGLSQAYLWKQIASPDSSLIHALVYSVSGGLAIVSAMKFHEKFIKKEPSVDPT